MTDTPYVKCAVLHKNGLFLEAAPGCAEELWIFLGKNVGWGRFTELPFQPGTFGLCEVLPEPSPGHNPESVVQGVLWRRLEAIAADQQISAYLADLESHGRGFCHKLFYEFTGFRIGI